MGSDSVVAKEAEWEEWEEWEVEWDAEELELVLESVLEVELGKNH